MGAQTSFIFNSAFSKSFQEENLPDQHQAKYASVPFLKGFVKNCSGISVELDMVGQHM